MVRRNYPYLAFRAWFLSITTAATLFSNPIMVPDYTPITEIQATSPTKWTIEIDLDNIHFSRSKSVYSTDTLMLDFITSSMSASGVSMKNCVIPEVVDTDNIVLLTEKHFPNLLIQPNKRIYLGLTGQNPKWSAVITQNITSTGSSLKFMYKQDSTYILSACPSLGTRNLSEPAGRVTGTVRDKNLNLIGGLLVSCKPNLPQNTVTTTSRTSRDGYFQTVMLDTCHKYSLTFYNDSGQQISGTVIGPLTIRSGTLIQRDVVLNDYEIPPVSVLHPGPGLKSKILVRFLPSDNSARQIVLAISSSPPSQKEQLDIYSMNGLHIRSLSFACTGSGTYTIPWDGLNKKNRQAPVGSYVCRVTIGNEVLCKGIITN